MHSPGLGRCQDGGLRNHAQCPLPSNEQLLQIVPGVVFSERLECVHNRAIRQDHLQAQHCAVQRAISEEAQPARVGGDVAPNLAAALCPKVEREHVPGIAKSSDWAFLT